MKQSLSISSLITVISLFFGVIWLSPVFAAGAPTFAPLGQIKAEALRVPGAMDLDAAGNLYVADARGGLVHKFNAYGNLVQSFPLGGSGRGLAVTPDGTRLYLSRGQAVVMFDPLRGAEIGVLAGSANVPEFGLAGKIDLDATGNVFVIDDNSAQIKVYNAAGQYLNRFGGAGLGSGKFMQIGGMAVNPYGQVVVADSSIEQGRVQVFTLDAQLKVASIAAYGKTSSVNFGSPAMNSPRGIAFDAAGRGYFLDHYTSSVRVAGAGFGFLTVYAPSGSAVDLLRGLGNATFDTVNSRLFVACGSGRIEILGVDGGQNPVFSNRAPSVPLPQGPVAGSEIDPTNPVLVFANAIDADGDALTYQIVIRQGAELVYQAVLPGSAGKTTSAPVVGAGLAENGVYKWTVQAFDATSSSEVSVVAGFVVNAIDDAPTATGLLTPAVGEKADGETLLSWTESVDLDPNDYVVNYRVEIASDATFSELVAQQEVAGTSMPLGALEAYAQIEDSSLYFWRVIAFDKDLTASQDNPVGQFFFDTTQLTISANVPGAQVYFGGNHAFAGRWIGAAPMVLRDLPAGPISIVIERPGFEPYVTTRVISDRENVTLAAALIPALQGSKFSNVKNGINGRNGLVVDVDATPFLVDFDNSGTFDLLVGDAAGRIQLFANMVVDKKGALTFDQGVPLGLPVLPGAVPFVADWDNDGRKDLIVGLTNGTVRLFLNVGSEFSPAFDKGQELVAGNDILSVGSLAAPAVVDYNGDDLKDLIVGNSDGLVQFFINGGTDAEPQLQAPVTLFSVSGPVVPMTVDWNADGRNEVMVTASGKTSLFERQADGTYALLTQVEGNSDSYAIFPVDLDGRKGKDLLVGEKSGMVSLLAGSGKNPVDSFTLALLAKIEELSGFAAIEAPEALAAIAAIDTLVAGAEFVLAKDAAAVLATQVAAGAVQTSLLELADLLIF